jgi:hypothetical protein
MFAGIVLGSHEWYAWVYLTPTKHPAGDPDAYYYNERLVFS